MAHERGLTSYLMDGSRMSVNFPKQVKHDESVPMRLERLPEKEVLMLEADGALLASPFANITYLQVSPAPAVLPPYLVKDATLVG
jgi:hypothetical protein